MSKIMITLGMTAMLAFSVVLFITFVTAYMSPAKAVVVRINSYGEADIEMILLSLLLPVSMISSFFVIRNLEKEQPPRELPDYMAMPAMRQERREDQ